MTTTTIEYEEVVTQREKVNVCDECGREVDDNGVLYTPSGSRVSHQQIYEDEDNMHLHFCSECLDKMYDKDIDRSSVELAKEWANKKDDSGWTLAENIGSGWRVIKASAVLGTLALSCSIAAAATGAFVLASTIAGAWMLASLALVSLTIMFISDAYSIVGEYE